MPRCEGRGAVTEVRSYRGIVFLMGLCQLILTTDFSIVSVALPTIGRSLAIPPTLLSWIVAATALTFSGFLVLGGRLTDVLGPRRCLTMGMILFGLGSLSSAAAPSTYMLIAARALQGLGAALLSPSSFSLINTMIPEGPPRHRALGVFGTMQGLSVFIGLVVGGFLTTNIGWRSIFLLNVPAMVLAFALILRLVPKKVGGGVKAFANLPGAFLITVATALLLWALSLLGEAGLNPVIALATLGAAITGYAIFFVIDGRLNDPLVPRSIYRPDLIAGCLRGVGLLAGVGGLFLLANLYMQSILKFTAAQSGLGMLPYALTIIGAGQVLPSLLARFPLRVVALGGFVVNMSGLVVLALLAHAEQYVTAVLIGSIIAPLGSLVAFTALMGMSTAAVNQEQQGLASAVLITFQQIGVAIGGTVCLSVLAAAKTGGVYGVSAFQSGYLAAAILVLAGLLAAIAPIQLKRKLAAS